jgi:DNA-binding beta-propeller fold protein YncE
MVNDAKDAGGRDAGSMRQGQKYPSRRALLAQLGAGTGVAACASAPGGGRKRPSLTPMLYYLGAAKVFALLPEGGAPVTLVDQSPQDGQRPDGVNDGIAIDPGGGYIFWSNMGRAAEQDGSIWRCDLDGANVTPVVPRGGAFTPKQIRIDAAARKLYWADREGMAVMRCNLDGSGIETLVRTGDPVTDRGRAELWCVGIAVDAAAGQIYWTQKGGDNGLVGRIRRAPIRPPRGVSPAARRDIETLFSGLPEPIDLDLDLSTRTLYWSDRGDNTISRAPVVGPANFDPGRRQDREIVVRGLNEAIGVALDVKRGRMAYTTLGGDIGVAGLDGSSARMLATQQGMLTGVAWLG